MKKLILISVAMLTYLTTWSQETEATSKEVFIDLTEKPITMVWVNPDNDVITVTEKNFLVQVGIKIKSGMKTVNISLDGTPISSSRGLKVVDKEKHNFDELIEQEIILNEGNNLVKVTVVDNQGKVEFIERTIVLSTTVARLKRTDYALLFATDQYDEWGDLVNPVNDAKTIAKELEESYGYEIDLVENPTQDEVILRLREYAKKSYMPHDQLFIFFAGHGQFDDLLGQGYIVTKDSKKNDNAKTSYLSHSVLRNVVDNIPSQHTFLAMDVCFGGTFDPSIARAGSRGEDDIYNELSIDQFIERKLRFKTRKYAGWECCLLRSLVQNEKDNWFLHYHSFWSL